MSRRLCSVCSCCGRRLSSGGSVSGSTDALFDSSVSDIVRAFVTGVEIEFSGIGSVFDRGISRGGSAAEISLETDFDLGFDSKDVGTVPVSAYIRLITSVDGDVSIEVEWFAGGSGSEFSQWSGGFTLDFDSDMDLSLFGRIVGVNVHERLLDDVSAGGFVGSSCRHRIVSSPSSGDGPQLRSSRRRPRPSLRTRIYGL